MPDESKPKYVMECQLCEGSLTIIYDADIPVDEKDIKEHLKNLMQTHLDSEPSLHRNPKKPPPRRASKRWAKKVRPVP